MGCGTKFCGDGASRAGRIVTSLSLSFASEGSGEVLLDRGWSCASAEWPCDRQDAVLGTTLDGADERPVGFTFAAAGRALALGAFVLRDTARIRAFSN